MAPGASFLKIRPHYADAPLCPGVDGEETGVELAVSLRLLIPPGQPPKEEMGGCPAGGLGCTSARACAWGC